MEILATGKVNVSQKSEEEEAQEKQMAAGGMSSRVSTAGMSLLQAALARAGVTAETFATDVRPDDPLSFDAHIRGTATIDHVCTRLLCSRRTSVRICSCTPLKGLSQPKCY